MNAVLNLTDFCNLRCIYCYYSENEQKNRMSAETMEKILTFLYHHTKSLGDKLLNITFFGGEPLLEFDLMRHAVGFVNESIPKDIEVHYAINTNGTLLTDAILDYLSDNKIMIYLSLDGDSQSHNHNRPCANQEGSFEKIMPHFKRLAAMDVFLEKVITVATVKNTHKDIVFLLNQGFRNFILSPDFNDAWTRESFELLKTEYQKLAKLYTKHIQRNDRFYLNLIEDKIKSYLEGRTFKNTCCNIGRKIVAISPTGDFYPCTRFVNYARGNPYRVGSIAHGFDKKAMKTIETYHSKDKPDCADCTVKDRCLGNSCGCVSFSTTGTIEGVSPLVCEHERMLIAIADGIGEKLLG